MRHYSSTGACFGAVLLCCAAGWGTYAYLFLVRQSTEKCDIQLTCGDTHTGGGLPGGERVQAFSHSPWSIGGRDCPWFAANTERCKLPALADEAGAKDLCFDVAYWTDKKGHDCIWWTEWVTGDKLNMWSPVQSGSHEKCNTSPEALAQNPGPPKNMTASELLEMKTKCCVCGGGRAGRDYSGPLSGIHTAWQEPPQASLPVQHKEAGAKTPTHLTQCCACKEEAVSRALVGASEERKKEINENRRITGNPRPGLLACPGKMEIDFDASENQNTFFIVAIIATSVLVLANIGVCLLDCRKPATQGGGSKYEGVSDDNSGFPAAGDAPFIVRL